MPIPIDIAVAKVKEFSSDLPGINLIFSDLEKVESWVVRKEQDDGFSQELRQRLYELTKEDIVTFNTKLEPLLWVLFFIPTSSSLYILNTLSEITPNISDMLLEKAISIINNDIDDKRHAQVFIDRCTHLNAANFIGHIIEDSFSHPLLEAIQQTKRNSGDVY